MERYIEIKNTQQKKPSVQDLISWGIVRCILAEDKIIACSSENAAKSLSAAKRLPVYTMKEVAEKELLLA